MEENNNIEKYESSKGLIQVKNALGITNKLLKEFDKKELAQIFKSVKIGNQIWMQENLNVDRFRNGELIPHAKTTEEWVLAGNNKQAAWCYYDNDPENGKLYGKLYNWYAVNDPRGLAPEGWHVPSDKEWDVLINYLGGKELAGIKMKNTTGWYNNGNGNNKSGFTGLPGSDRISSGRFNSVDSSSCWWSSTEYDAYFAWFRFLNYNNGNVFRFYNGKGRGFSVRCLRD